MPLMSYWLTQTVINLHLIGLSGVDSMVLFKILTILRDAYSRSKRPAIHIQDILVTLLHLYIL